jgi:hypothetical protein
MPILRTHQGTVRKASGFAFDPRLLIGLLLVVASVMGVVFVVSAADRTSPVYLARGTLTVGETITVDDLSVSNVRMEGAGTLYLEPGDVPIAGLVVTRTVAQGELVPASAIGNVTGLRLTSLVVDTGGTLAASIKPGSSVDLWAAREIENGKYSAPAVLVAGAMVLRLVTSDSIVGAGQVTAIEVLVPKAKVARVLESIANDDAISVVPLSIPGKG